MDERLWDYIDAVSDATERSAVEKLLETHAEWKARHRELLELSGLIQSSELEAPSLRFTRNVMEEISRLHIAPATRTYINKKIIWGIAIFFISVILGFLGYGFGQMEWSTDGSSSIATRISQIDLSLFFNNTWVNAFMMINVVLGLFLLDNYLGRKRQAKFKGKTF